MAANSSIKPRGFRPDSPTRRADTSKPIENLTVTVRFRPLSGKEAKKGDSAAWYADGESTVRHESNPNIAYAFDRVFGPATTTHHVYDAAAHHVVSTPMQGINGTIFAYGVTSSGKTHTMHGLQKSPGIVPLAVKHVFDIIQETPGREFLLRVSFLEIYNEVINDLLHPTAQNLRIREDTQGTYIEGIKEEVVLSPAHALSLIATGEEHRHVGSNNFNLLSSRSHTIFTLTIESSPCGQSQGEEDVTLSQLHLIDLAGSESSKAETNGLRRKEGSYINKSLLTLGTVISKLTDAKATHIPYRDSKLTRLLQSSLSGNGRISLICTVTPASSNTEETHNTLKFASRSKHVEIKASQNKILDEKSLIKKYQKEISHLKEELHGLKHGMKETIYASTQDEPGLSKIKPEPGQVNLLSRLEEEEQAKAALNGRIQRLTKLILVSTKSTVGKSTPRSSVYRRGHSFCEDELAYLPNERREYVSECDDDGDGILDAKVLIKGCGNANSLDEIVKDHKKHAKKGMLGWLKSRKFERGVGLSSAAQSSPSGSLSSCSTSSRNRVAASDAKDSLRKSVSVGEDDLSAACSYQERSQAGEYLDDSTVGASHLIQTGLTIADQVDLLNEQVEHIAGEVGICTSSLKRLSEQRVNNTEDPQAEEQMQILKNEIVRKKLLIRQLEHRLIQSLESAPQMSRTFEMSQALTKLTAKLNDKICELKTKSADNRILQEQLDVKVSENSMMQEKILLQRQQLCPSVDKSSIYPQVLNQSAILNSAAVEKNLTNAGVKNKEETSSLSGTVAPTSITRLNGISSHEAKECKIARSLNSQLLLQADEIKILKHENLRLAEEKYELENHSQQLANEASYAKELAAAAAMEVQHLTEKVTKLSYRNAELVAELGSFR